MRKDGYKIKSVVEKVIHPINLPSVMNRQKKSQREDFPGHCSHLRIIPSKNFGDPQEKRELTYKQNSAITYKQDWS